MHICHDYGTETREQAANITTVGEQKRDNIHVGNAASEQQFVEMRTARDATLSMPVLMIPSVQVNIRAGALPPEEINGIRYIKIPVDVL